MTEDILNSLCPCGSNQFFQECCEPLIKREMIAQSPEQLMRSRYSAFATLNENYLLQTWHPETRPSDLSLPTLKEQRWIKLVIHSSEQKTVQGQVHFTAYSLQGKQALVLSEQSQFIKLDGLWLYHSGLCEVDEYTVGRNQACLCGSQKKFKRCCMT